MATLGSGRFTYEVSGENWGKLPEGWYYKEATSVDVDSKDNVYVFNRGNHPMIVFDRNAMAEDVRRAQRHKQEQIIQDKKRRQITVKKRP